MLRKFGFSILLVAVLVGSTAAIPGDVSAKLETQPVASSGDAADDSCVWVHPSDSSKSLVIGTDKKHGLFVYDVAGKQIQDIADGNLNNVDMRYNFPLGGKKVALVTAGNRTDNTLTSYVVDEATRTLKSAGPRVKMGIVVYGSCMYRSPVTGDLYFIVNSKDGEVEQWRMFDDGSGKLAAAKARAWKLASQTEGCVGDDHYGFVYVGEEAKGVWRFGGEPTDSTTGVMIDKTGSGGHLTADVEGLTIYTSVDGSGYLIASSQGANEFAVYNRDNNQGFLSMFKIVTGNGIDGVSDCDGIDVCNLPLGAGFPSGAFIAQDGTNDGGNQNYKLVPWESIAKTNSLKVDTICDPRQMGANSILFHTTPLGECVENSLININVKAGKANANARFAVLGSFELTSNAADLKNPSVLVVSRLDSAGQWISPKYLMPAGTKGLTVFGRVVTQDLLNGGVKRSDILPTRVH